MAYHGWPGPEILSQNIKRARFNNFLVRILGMDQDAPSPQLQNFIQPTINVEASNPEDLFLVQTRLWTVAHTVALVAAKTNTMRIRNPQASGMLVVVMEVSCTELDGIGETWIGGTGSPLNNGDLALLPAAGELSSMDSRWGNNGASAGQPPFVHVSFDNSPPALASSNVFRRVTQANSLLLVDKPVVLGPGSVYDVSSLTVNHNTAFDAWGFERALPDVELGN